MSGEESNISDTARRVVATANSLLLAVNQLQRASSTPQPQARSHQPPSFASRSSPLPSAGPSSRQTTLTMSTALSGSSTQTSSGSSFSQEMNKLFHWNASKKRSAYFPQKKSKKKRIQTWTHTFVCLSNINDKWVVWVNCGVAIAKICLIEFSLRKLGW